MPAYTERTHYRWHSAKRNREMGEHVVKGILLMALGTMIGSTVSEELPSEMPLWPEGILDNPIQYAEPEAVRESEPRDGSPSGRNRVYSLVSVPTYVIHRPEKDAGVGLVILPGGGYRDVWFDREGQDLAIVLKEYGITSLVLKYRTNASIDDTTRAFPWEIYRKAVEADATEALRILREDNPKRKVGMAGFSAGGGLTMSTMLNTESAAEADYLGLFYPGVSDRFLKADLKTAGIPPVFMMNAFNDPKTPVDRCLMLYSALQKAGIRSELHVYGRGNHGFDLGHGRGYAVSTWLNSFVAWLRDEGILED